MFSANDDICKKTKTAVGNLNHKVISAISLSTDTKPHFMMNSAEIECAVPYTYTQLSPSGLTGKPVAVKLEAC